MLPYKKISKKISYAEAICINFFSASALSSAFRKRSGWNLPANFRYVLPTSDFGESLVKPRTVKKIMKKKLKLYKIKAINLANWIRWISNKKKNMHNKFNLLCNIFIHGGHETEVYLLHWDFDSKIELWIFSLMKKHHITTV